MFMASCLSTLVFVFQSSETRIIILCFQVNSLTYFDIALHPLLCIPFVCVFYFYWFSPNFFFVCVFFVSFFRISSSGSNFFFSEFCDFYLRLFCISCVYLKMLMRCIRSLDTLFRFRIHVAFKSQGEENTRSVKCRKWKVKGLSISPSWVRRQTLTGRESTAALWTWGKENSKNVIVIRTQGNKTFRSKCFCGRVFF